MAAAAPGPVELGFAEEAPAWRLRSEQFPSKVGGRPAWLGLAELPGPGALACARCGRPLAFLLQVYAPLPGRDDAFHPASFSSAVASRRAAPACEFFVISYQGTTHSTPMSPLLKQKLWVRNVCASSSSLEPISVGFVVAWPL